MSERNRVQPAIFVLSVLLIPVLVVAFLILYAFPQIGIDNFAWPVRPLMTSMMLGATYLGGAYFFLVVVLSRKWRHVWLGFLPISAFAGSLGIATLLHWDRFVHERFTFQVWAFLYFTVPLILPVLWYRNFRQVDDTDLNQGRSLSTRIRWAFGALGSILTLAGLLLLIIPEQMLAIWPWTLTPLTARVMSVMFLLPGLVGLSVAYIGRWSSARYLLQAQAFTIILMLMAIYMARADFEWERAVSWVFAGGLTAVLMLILTTYLSMRE